LVIANGRGQPVKYVIRHVPLYFKTVELDGSGELAASGKKSEYGEQTVEKSLAANEKLETYLEDIYGWATKPRSEMEGCLLVSPVPAAAAQQTTVTCDVLPNDK
jgi:hypothetical protein